MRQVGKVDEAAKASIFADYMLTQGVETRILQAKDGWEIWVINEDQVPASRQQWARFSANPGAPEYSQAVGAARQMRLAEEKTESRYEKRQVDFQRKVSGNRAFVAPVTVSLVLISGALFLATMAGDKNAILRHLWFTGPYLQQVTPESGPDSPSDSLARPLASILRGEIWRLFTPIFVHGSFLHLLFNILMVTSLGTAVEKYLGSGKMVFMVLVLAFVSNCAQAFFGPTLAGGNTSHFGGLSGVVYGLAGFAWVMGRQAPGSGLALDGGTTWILLGWFVLGILMSNQTGNGLQIANWCHGGGLVAGLILGAVVARGNDEQA